MGVLLQVCRLDDFLPTLLRILRPLHNLDTIRSHFDMFLTWPALYFLYVSRMRLGSGAPGAHARTRASQDTVADE